MVPEFIMLIGLPGCGKSTIIKLIREVKPHQEYVVTSSDNMIMEYAARNNLNYREAHDALDPIVLRNMLIEQAAELFSRNMSIINDQTNLNDDIRKAKLAMVPQHYIKRAVVIKKPIDVILRQQNSLERLAQGKTIPSEVMNKMISEFTDPDPKDFDEIVVVQ